jgi:hypothetical protein
MNWPRIFRLVNTAVLLAMVWFHAHWSVALAITLLTIYSEITIENVALLIKNFKLDHPRPETPSDASQKNHPAR